MTPSSPPERPCADPARRQIALICLAAELDVLAGKLRRILAGRLRICVIEGRQARERATNRCQWDNDLMEAPADNDSRPPEPEPSGPSKGLQLMLTVLAAVAIIAGAAVLAGRLDTPDAPSTTTIPSTTTTTSPAAESLAPLWLAAEHLVEAYAEVPTVDLRRLADAAASGLAEVAELTMPGVDIDAVPEGVPEGFEEVWAHWLQIHRERTDVDTRSMMVEAIERMVATTGDPDAAVLVDVSVEPDGYVEDAFYGIGAFVNAVEGFVVISQPFPGSPASRAGIRPGDVVVGVDGESVIGMPIDEVVAMVRGPAGTSVRLLIEREGTDPVEVEVIREPLELGTARSYVHPDGIGYLKVSSFESRTAGEVERELEALLVREIRALIIDLRGNDGGSPAAGLAVADHLLDGELIYLEDELDGTRIAHHAQSGGLATDLPLAILIDQGTSDVAELVAAALRVHQRGPLIGLPSGGDSTLHKGYELGGGIVVVVRSGSWLAPNERLVPSDGLVPDHTVGLTEDDLSAGFDRPQQAANAYLWSLVEGRLDEALEPSEEVPSGG